MLDAIDDQLDICFSPKRIIDKFIEYKYLKWDHFSDPNDPKIKIPMGADGVKYEAFEKQIYRNANNISRRIIEDRYIFYPFREREVLKAPIVEGKKAKYRILSISSIRDILVQAILYAEVLYTPIENLFSSLDRITPVSFAYRRNKSAPKAAELVHRYIQEGYRYVFDADLTKFFDTIPHDLLLAKLANVIGGDRSKTYRLVRRYIKTDRVPYNTYRYIRKNGKPLGSKIFYSKKPKESSGLLAFPKEAFFLECLQTYICTSSMSGYYVNWKANSILSTFGTQTISSY